MRHKFFTTSLISKDFMEDHEKIEQVFSSMKKDDASCIVIFCDKNQEEPLSKYLEAMIEKFYQK